MINDKMYYQQIRLENKDYIVRITQKQKGNNVDIKLDFFQFIEQIALNVEVTKDE